MRQIFVHTMIGTKLAHYEITTHIGSGGMGDVYQATDTKLGRYVAIKFLPEAFSHDTERVARFQREARVLASLNHPNIAAIHGLEEIDSRHFLVMELVEGETLADRIKRGAIPIEEALPIAKQIVEALEEAHDSGVVHRDLKPANIKVTPDGKVKVLDFGLAKAYEGDQREIGIGTSNSPTMISMAATNAGVILGTAAYMSPEQARGRVADRRSDIWSFGAVLYETLSGKQAFGGESASDILASVLKVEPDWSALPHDAPAWILNLVRRCLTKDRKRRLQAIGEARIVLEDTPEEKLTAPPTANLLLLRLGWISSGLFAVALIVFGFINFRSQATGERTLRYTIEPPGKGAVHSFAISPDGNYVALAALVNGKQQLWLRPLDALEAEAMPTTEDATYPFWSPDSHYIGFFAQGKLKKVAATGGVAQSLCDAKNARGGSWNRDEVIVFSQSGGSGEGIQRVPAAGGVPTNVFKSGVFRYPAFLPDGRHFLYTDIQPSENTGIHVSSLNGADNRRVLPDRSGAIFVPLFPGSPAGHLLFVRGNSLMALPFDANTAKVSGEAFPIAEGVSVSASNAGYAPVSSSELGVLLYSSGTTAGGTNQMAWYDRSGKLLGPFDAPSSLLFSPAISPDEKSVAFAYTAYQTRAGVDIWLRDLVRGTDTRFTAGGQNFAPLWSPTGDRIAFLSRVFVNDGKSGFGLYNKSASGSGPAERLIDLGQSPGVSQWSRDGRFIVYSDTGEKSQLDLWILPVSESERKPIRFLQTEFNEFLGQLSPDSRWMAYTSDESGRPEVYVRPFPPSDGKWKISTAGGEQPRWRSDGKELFYVAADGKMVAAPVKPTVGPRLSFDVAVPEPLFESHITSSLARLNLFQYDVTSDGKRFLVVTSGVLTSSSPPLTVVVNWNAGLKK
jgi:eukaryotic-like serine/threonine-protein kinase